MKESIYRHFISLGALALFLATVPRPYPMAGASAGCGLDQSQEGASTGFWFEDDIVRWQQIVPTTSVLCKLDLFIHKVGKAGNVIVELYDLLGTLLWQGSIKEADLVDGWNTITVSPPVGLTAGVKHIILLRTDTDSPDEENRYYWQGQTESAYTAGVTDVEEGWPGFDYAFRTYSDPTITYPSSSLEIDSKSYKIGATMYLNKWTITGGSKLETFDYRMWISVPGYGAVSLLSVDSLVWPAGYVYNVLPGGPLPLVTFSSALPLGHWEIGTRLIDHSTGALLNVVIDPFTLTATTTSAASNASRPLFSLKREDLHSFKKPA